LDAAKLLSPETLYAQEGNAAAEVHLNPISISSRYGDSSVTDTKNEVEIMVPLNLNNGEGVNETQAPPEISGLELDFDIGDDEEKR